MPNKIRYLAKRLVRPVSSVTVLLAVIMPANRLRADDSNSHLSLNVLQAPAAPGFVLLGIEPAAVERPGTLSDLAIGVVQNTQAFSIIPRNYALELAPLWLLGGKNITYEQYRTYRNLLTNSLQTLSISVATAPDLRGSDSLATSLAAGLRFSPLRGRIDEDFNGYIDSLKLISDTTALLADSFNRAFKSLCDNDPQLDALDSAFKCVDSQVKPSVAPFYESLIESRRAELKETLERRLRQKYESSYAHIRSAVAGMQLRRIGWKLDVAGGALLDLPRSEFDSARLGRVGFWLTGGHEWRNWSLLGVARFLSDMRDSSGASIDAGVRVIRSGGGVLTPSIEALYRCPLGADAPPPQTRCALVLDCQIAKNNTISFTMGGDFGGKAASRFIFQAALTSGFGTDRRVR